MDRITDKFLQAVCDRINRAQGTPLQPYAKDTQGAYKPQAKCYHLSHAYGGVSLHQMCDTGSGVHDVFGCGHVPKRELSERMFAFIKGLGETSELARLRAENETLRAALARLVAAPDLWLDEMEDETIKALEQARAALDQSNKGE